MNNTFFTENSLEFVINAQIFFYLMPFVQFTRHFTK